MWPGPSYLVKQFSANPGEFVHGDRIVPAAAVPSGWSGALAQTADNLVFPDTMPMTAWVAEQRWIVALAPTNPTAAYWSQASVSTQTTVDWEALAALSSIWTRANPGLDYVLLVRTAGQYAALQKALRAEFGTTPDSVSVVMAPLPPPWIIQRPWMAPLKLPFRS